MRALCWIVFSVLLGLGIVEGTFSLITSLCLQASYMQPLLAYQLWVVLDDVQGSSL